jgi:4-aminobutyrate aminotransferase-like enzyme
VTVSRFRGGTNPHHTITEKLAWDLLERLMAGDLDAISEELGTAGGLVRVPSARGTHLLEQRSTFGPSLSLSYQQPLNVVRGSGQYLFDERGRRYLDCVNNVCHVGHSNPVVAAAGANQMFVLNTNTRYLHAEAIRYAERVLATLPDHLDRVFLVNSGSEANELAIRLVRTSTGRTDMVCLEHGYHGNTSTLIEVSPYKFNLPGGMGQGSWVHVLPSPDPYRVPEFSGFEGPARYRALADEVLADTVPAGLIIEALPGCGGQVVPSPGVPNAACDAVRARGGLVIADEVQTGFGRTGEFWAFKRYNLEPDVVTMGKPAGNGHPLAAVATTRAIAEAFDDGMEYFNTFGGNPVSAAIGNAVLDEIDRLDVVNHGRIVGERLLRSLIRLADRHRAIGDVRGAGLYLGIEFVEDRVSKYPATSLADDVVEYAKEQGVLLSTDGPFRNVIKIKPPMVFDSADADRLVDVIDQALTAASS